MKSRNVFLWALLGLALITLSFLYRGRSVSTDSSVEVSRLAESGTVATTAVYSKEDDVVLKEDLSSTTLKGYGAPSASPMKDLELIFECIELFQIHLKSRTDLPTSGNRELTFALLGANNDRIRFIATDGAHINAQGELIDRWQTPLFFHFEDAHYPEIRSAGPDQTMWTADDLSFDFFDGEDEQE